MSGDILKPLVFSKWRAMFWPIRGWETKKVLPMAMMMAFILFNYSILRGTKDALIITAGGSGVEVISFIKLWIIIPFALLFVFIYAKLSNIFNRATLFYLTITPFLIFFALFALLLYPNRELLHPSMETIDALKAAYPRFQWLFPIWGHWTYVLFYIMAEMWVSVVLNLMFWQFANEITRVTEAKRFYALLGLIGSLFVFLAGNVLKYFSKFAEGSDAWGVSLNYLMGSVVICGLLVIYFYNWMEKHVLPDPRYFSGQTLGATKKKIKLSMRESFKHVITSRYLGFIALLVICYGVTINLIEMTWKHTLRIQHPDPNAYTHAMGTAIQWVGLVTFVLTIIGVNILRMCTWFTAAIISPIVFGATGAIFFLFILFPGLIGPVSEFFGISSLLIAVWLGTFQNVFSKATKYALFDPTKEMAYIPLDDDLKVKGKAAVDVVGSRLGKSGGALIQQGLLIAIIGSDQMTIAPYLFGIIMLCIAVWIFAVVGLNYEFRKLASDQDDMREDISEESQGVTQQNNPKDDVKAEVYSS